MENNKGITFFEPIFSIKIPSLFLHHVQFKLRFRS
jgi:hypothetical protein